MREFVVRLDLRDATFFGQDWEGHATSCRKMRGPNWRN
jgi:hypothetical protein